MIDEITDRDVLGVFALDVVDGERGVGLQVVVEHLPVHDFPAGKLALLQRDGEVEILVHAAVMKLVALGQVALGVDAADELVEVLTLFAGDAAALDKGLDVLLSDDVPSQDVRLILANAASHNATRAGTMNWLMRNWDALRARLPGFLAGRIFELAGQACAKEEVDRLTSFFTPRVRDSVGGSRPLAEALETASMCEALRDKDTSKVDEFFGVKRPVATGMDSTGR